LATCRINRRQIELDLKADFPILADGRVYLDSASTSLTPKCVIDRISNYLLTSEANYNRGQNDLVFRVNSLVDAARQKVADFIACPPDHICFSSGASASSRLIADQIAINDLSDGDEILLCKLDHQSTIKPWQDLTQKLKRFGTRVNISEIKIDSFGDYVEDELVELVNNRTKFIILTHIHNVYGLEMNIPELITRIREKNPNSKIVLDASQSIGHINVSVADLDVDYLYFSGHKMFATTGIGILYSKEANIKVLEFGTPNILGIISLGASIDYINSIGINNIDDHIYGLTRYLYERLLEIPGIEFNKGIHTCSCKLGYGIISFKHIKIPSEEINEVLNNYGIYVRSNNFCQKGQDDFIRVSLQVYNTRKDIDKLIHVLELINKKKI